LTVDPEARRIYISRSTHVMIVDEDSGKVIGDILDTKGVHGIALAPDLGKGYTSNGGAASVTIFDIKTLKPVSTVKTTREDPDSILYDPETKRVFTFNGPSANSTAIDAYSDDLRPISRTTHLQRLKKKLQSLIRFSSPTTRTPRKRSCPPSHLRVFSASQTDIPSVLKPTLPNKQPTKRPSVRTGSPWLLLSLKSVNL
jgi:DNA-binding beta-propeller fold protein YncE